MNTYFLFIWFFLCGLTTIIFTPSKFESIYCVLPVNNWTFVRLIVTTVSIITVPDLCFSQYWMFIFSWELLICLIQLTIPELNYLNETWNQTLSDIVFSFPASLLFIKKNEDKYSLGV